MSGMIIYKKFMKKEELINLLKDLRRFEMETSDGRRLVCDKRVDEQRPEYVEYDCRVVVCHRATAFKLSAFDIIDCLTCGEGYVRYNSWSYNGKDTRQGRILMNNYGFERED